MDVFIPPDSQSRLVHLSRQTLNDFVLGVERDGENISDPHLQTRAYGAFVSLHKEKKLRGCVGNCAPNAALYQMVIAMTQAAASQDSRVVPISEDELDDIRIDITVLSALVKVSDPLSLEIGKHGLYIEQEERRGVLLPQVAAQYRWDINTFLEETCVKAGLGKQAWKEAATEVSTFTALIIGEEG
jgi:AmmeMemoRadiSam system protein A